MLAYLYIRKLLVEHLLKFILCELLYNGWVDPIDLYDLIKQLSKLKHTLQYNLKSISLLPMLFHVNAIDVHLLLKYHTVNHFKILPSYHCHQT